MDDGNNFRQELMNLLESYRGRLPIIEGVVSGQFPVERIRALGVRLYAEARSALQVKIPERLRVVPIEAGELRRFWCHILDEESGDFRLGRDHGSLIAVTCYALGVTQAQLDEEYRNYLPSLDAIRQEEPSIDTSLREVARMYVEEAILAREANRLGDALRDNYGVPEDALFYFRLHAIADIEHSDAALNELVQYARSPEHKRLVLQTVRQSLESFPIWIDR